MEKFIVVVMFLGALLFPVSAAAEEEGAENQAVPAIHGQYGVVIDAKTGDVLYEKNAYEQAFPASTTKIMTALLLEEHVDDQEQMEASEWAAGQEASNYHFKLTAGEKITKENALFALMVMSANDVAVAIAEHIAGSQEEFGVMMTDKAKELGAKNTNYVTASGLHAPAHFTTAYDMALITKEALKYPAIMEAMGTTSITLETDRQKVDVSTANKIMENPYAIGGKTGYTGPAQNTLVEVLEKDGKLVIAVVMKTTLAEEYNDIDIMSTYAFEHMDRTETVVAEGEIVGTETLGDTEVTFVAAEDLHITATGGEQTYQKLLNSDDLSGRSVKEGEVIGTLEVKDGERVVGSVPLISTADLEIGTEGTKSKEAGGNDGKEGTLTIGKVLLAILIPFVLYVAFVIFYNIKKRQERNATQRRAA